MLLKKHKISFFPSLFILLGFINLAIPFANQYFFRTYAYDYAAYNFAFNDFAHLNVSPCPLYHYPYPVTFLQDHFSFLLILLSPLYWLLNPIFGNYALLFIQWCFIILGSIYTFRFIKLKTGNLLQANLSTLLYFVICGRYTSYAADCNLTILGSSLIPIFFYLFEKENKVKLFILTLVIIFTREDFPLWLAFISLFLALVYRKERSKLKVAIVLLVLNLFFFFLIMQWLIPLFEDENKKFMLFNYSALGKNFSEALLFVLKNPISSLKLLFVNHTSDPQNDYIKLEFYIVYGLSGLFFLFRKPLYLIPLIPLIAKKMFNDAPIRWGCYSYYSIEWVCILPILVFMLLASLKSDNFKKYVGISICVIAILVNVYKFSEKQVANRYENFYKLNFFSNKFYKPFIKSFKKTKAIIDSLPKDAKICASPALLGNIPSRLGIYYFIDVLPSDYVIYQKRINNWPYDRPTCERRIKETLATNEWDIVFENRDIIYLKRKGI